MRVLVTGGRGFIGRWVVEALQDHGHRPVVLDCRDSPYVMDGCDFHWGDIRDYTAVHQAMAHVDAWIHLAGVLGTSETITTPLPAVETNILGGLNVLEAAAEFRLPGVNIAVGNHWMANTYAISKATVERFCEMYRKERGVPVTVVRALNAYGPGQVPAAPYGSSKVRKIMPAFVCRALVNEPIEVYGDGGQIMDMIFVGDVAEILVQALEHTIVNGGSEVVIEAGTGRATTVKDIATMVCETAGSTAGIKYLPMRPGEPTGSIVLGNPRTLQYIQYGGSLVSLEDGVKQTIDWYRGQYEGL